MRPGIELLLDLLGFDEAVRGARLVVTGEGCLDARTLHGGAPAGVAAAAARAGVRVAAGANGSRRGGRRDSAAPATGRARRSSAEYRIPDSNRCYRRERAAS